jgi:hypothetical protein
MARHEAAAPVPVARRAREPSVVTGLFPLLECHRHIAGMAGAYWLLPMMYMMVHATPATTAAVPVPCPPVAGRALCVGLPAGCQVRYHWWPRNGWRSHARLVAFLLFHQCETITGEFGSWRRMRDGRRGDNYFPLTPESEALLLVTVGGVPVATAGVQQSDAQAWYVAALCAVTGSGGGTLAVRHLQTFNRTILADATATSLGFYLRLGFTQSNAEVDPLSLQWH